MPLKFDLNYTYTFFILAVMLLLLMMWHLGYWGVLETSEARYAEISREMLASGNWIEPQLLGIYHFDKPIITYWISGFGQYLFGVNPFGCRFFLQVAYLFQLFLVFKISVHLFSSTRKAFFAFLIYAGFPLVLISVRNLTTDAYLNTFELLGVYLWIRHTLARKPLWLYLFFIDLGVAILTKGPVGLLLPLLMIYPIQKILAPERKNVNAIHVWAGTALMLLIGSSWFVALVAQSPQLYHFFMGQQIIDRMFHAQVLRRNEPFWYYLAYFPLLLFPFILLIPQTVIRAIRQKDNAVGLILLFGIGIPLLFFSISSSKRVLYVLPMAPYVAILAGWLLDELPWPRLKKYAWMTSLFYLILLLATGAVFLGMIPSITIVPTLPAWIILLAGMGLLMASVCNMTKTKLIAQSLLFPVCLIPVSTYILHQAGTDINAITPVVNYLEAEHLDQRKIVVWDKRLPSLAFELEKAVYSVYDKNADLDRNTAFQENDNWKKNLINIHQPDEVSYLKQLINQPSILLVKGKDFPDDFKWILQTYPNLRTIGKWSIYY